jgi:hypothetical protein
MGVYKLSANSVKNGRTIYGSMLAGNTAFLPTDFESIATVSVGSGGTSTITFSSIPSTYAHLQIRGILRASRNDAADGIIIQYNGDTASNYSSHFVRGEGASAGAGSGVNQSSMSIQDTMPGQTSAANLFGTVIIDILDYANTNKYKTQRSLGGNDRNGAGYIDFSSGNWRNTNAITSIDIKALYGTGFAQYSHFALYGIKA